MPAEWKKQEAVWLQWPHEDDCHGYQMKLESIWLQVTETLKQNAIVHICIQDEKRREHIKHQLQFYSIGLDHIKFHIIPTNDVWIRDNGPTFVVGENGELAAIGWQFNGWGNRYPHDLDKEVSRQIAETLRVPFLNVPLVTEGGNIEVNGEGDLLCTRSAVLNKNRNPEMSQEDVERIFKTYLGVKNIIWLPGMENGKY